MDKNLSREAQEKIDKMVERVARKSGYSDRENMTYKEHIQAKFEHMQTKVENKYKKYRKKFSMKPRASDFSDEIRTYLQDGLIDLMKEGHSEEEAIKITMDKFDDAELNENFYEFIEEFGGFGMEDYKKTTEWYAKNGETIGLFYAAFVMFGMVLGTFLGYIIGHTLINILIGFGMGLFTGVGCGLLSNAIISMKKDK